MAEKAVITPLSEDALNRFRITHSDRDLRPLLRRLHRLAHVSSGKGGEAMDKEHEAEMARLELARWRSTTERILGSVQNLERQKAAYEARTGDTVRKTEEFRDVLKDEMELLERRRMERKRMMECDEVAARIHAKGKTRAELDEQIAAMTQSLEEHTETNQVYNAAARVRSEKFAEIVKLVEEVRGTRLPDVSPTTVDSEAHGQAAQTPGSADEDGETDKTESGEVDQGRLNVTALPFQPSSSGRRMEHSASVPNSRATTPPTSGDRGRYALPLRPTRAPAGAMGSTPPNSSSVRLPARPTTLRSVTTSGPSALEEGEVGFGGAEDGEVGERRGTKRAADERERGGGRSSRTRT